MASFPQDKPKMKKSKLVRKTERRRSVRNVPDFPDSRYILRRSNPDVDFEKLSPLGIGSFGTVYKCRSLKDQQIYAVKTVKEDDRHQESELVREIGFLRHCESNYVCKFHDAYYFEGKMVIVLEHFEAGSVHDVMKMAQVKMPEDFIFDIVTQTLLALEFLKSRRVVHRDIKAGNILLLTNGISKLCDFGVSRLFKRGETFTKTIIGTPYWMAPEIVEQSGYAYNCDVWSLGITMIEMKDGGPPLSKIAAIRAMYVAQRRPPPTFLRPNRATIPLRELLAKMVVKDRKERPEAADLLKDPAIKSLADVMSVAFPVGGSEAIKRVVDENLDKVITFRNTTKFVDDSEVDDTTEDSGLAKKESVLIIGSNKQKPKKISKQVRQESLVQLEVGVAELLRAEGNETESDKEEEDADDPSIIEVDFPSMDSDIETLVIFAVEPVEDSDSEDTVLELKTRESVKGVETNSAGEDDAVPKIERLNSGKENQSSRLPERLSKRVTLTKAKTKNGSFMLRKSIVRFSSTTIGRVKDEVDQNTLPFDKNKKPMVQLKKLKKQLILQRKLDLKQTVEMYRKQCKDIDNTGV